MSNNANRAYSAAHFALELDGRQNIGLFRSVEGGGVRADVMTYQNGANYDRWRSLGKQKYDDLKVQVGMAMSKPFFDWISDFAAGNPVRKNGAIVAADFHYIERARYEFTSAMVKELTFPKLDGEDKNAAYLTVGIAVEGVTFAPGRANSRLAQAAGMDTQKLWTPANFSLSLDGFDQACARVTKIDSFTIKQRIIEHHVGGQQAPIKLPSQIEYPSLTFYVPEVDARPFLDHFNKRAMILPRQQRSAGANKTGMLQTFDTENNPLFTLEFYEAEITSVQPDKSDSTSQEIRQVKVEMFVEKMTFTHQSMSNAVVV